MSDPERLSEAEVASLFEPGWLARCDWCGWPLAAGIREGCAEDFCSMRPMPSNADTPRKAIVRKMLAERAALREALRNLVFEGLTAPGAYAEDHLIPSDVLRRRLIEARALLAPQKAEKTP